MPPPPGDQEPVFGRDLTPQEGAFRVLGVVLFDVVHMNLYVYEPGRNDYHQLMEDTLLRSQGSAGNQLMVMGGFGC